MTAQVFCANCDPKARSLICKLAGFLAQLDEHSESQWYWAYSTSAIDVNPGPEMDRLVSRVFDQLRTDFGISGYQGGGGIYEKLPLKAMRVFTATSEWLTTKLSFIYIEDEIFAFVSGSSKSPTSTTLQPWLSAIKAAIEIRNFHPIRLWQAVIGLARSNGYRHIICNEEATFGTMKISSPQVTYHELESNPTSLCSFHINLWQPLLVIGTSTGHSFSAVQFDAQEQLHLLCALLSVQTNQLWLLRHFAQSDEHGQFELPQSSETLKQVPCPPQGLADLRIDMAEVDRMRSTCNVDQTIARIVRAYYEALRLVDHPSYSLIGFVGVIEQVGEKLFVDGIQEKCDACSRPKGSSSATKFRKALSLVMSEERAKIVSQRLYKWRSGTAHAGRMHSNEFTFGHPQMSEGMFAIPNAVNFQMTGQMHGQEIARDLILYLLTKYQVSPLLGDQQILPDSKRSELQPRYS